MCGRQRQTEIYIELERKTERDIEKGFKIEEPIAPDIIFI